MATEYLQRARECADLAETLKSEDRAKLLEIADAWLRLAKIDALETIGPASAARNDGTWPRA
jgi:hypothetical protein